MHYLVYRKYTGVSIIIIIYFYCIIIDIFRLFVKKKETFV